MKNIISFTGMSLLALSVHAQLITNNGETIQNNGAVIATIGGGISNNGGKINNNGTIRLDGSYQAVGNGVMRNINVNDTIYLNGMWDNTAGWYDGTGNGVVVFNGIGQNINTVHDTIARLVITGTGDKTLNGNVTVRTNLNFTNNRIFTTSGDTLLLMPLCGFVGGAPSDASHVDGPVYRVGGIATQDLVYPVGDAGLYRPVTLKNVAGVAVQANRPVIGFEVVAGATGAIPGMGIAQMIDTRHWKATYVKGNYAGSPIELSYGLAESVTDQSQLLVAQSQGVAGPYHSLDESAVTGVPASGTVISEFDAHGNYFMIGRSANLRADLRVFLEGSYNTGTGLMSDSLYSSSWGSILANNYQYGHTGSNPYGVEMINGYPPGPSLGVNPVDVVMLTIRDVSAPTVDIDTTYAWLMQDGTIRDFSAGTKQYVTFSNLSLNSTTNYAIVVWHRNHIPVMFESTGKLIDQNTGAPSDFDYTDPTNVYGIGYKDLLGDGTISGMYIGNAEQTYSPLEVNALDLWQVANDAQNGLPSGYIIGTDVNMDGKTNQTDWDKTKWANDQLYYSTIP